MYFFHLSILVTVEFFFLIILVLNRCQHEFPSAGMGTVSPEHSE